MSNLLIQDFPVLQASDGNFADSIAYEVTADRHGQTITVKHILKGDSYVSRLVKNRTARFSVRLLYRDSRQRYHHVADDIDSDTSDEIVAKQEIPLKFSYAPEIKPSIILLEKQEITIDETSGLSDFWKVGERFSIAKYSRIAIHQDLRFTQGGVKQLMNLVLADELEDGEMKVEVNENVAEGDIPVQLYCGTGVYDQLKQIKQKTSVSNADVMRNAIITHALCAVYADMQKYVIKDEGYLPQGVLAAHLQEMQKKNLDWGDEDFVPSLAATKMWPYHINALKNEDDD